MKTRSKKPANGSKKNAVEGNEATLPGNQLGKKVDHPPNVFVLPKDISHEARIFDLPHPVSSNLHRYLFCPQKGFYEFTKIAVPGRDCRSWLIAPSQPGPDHNEAQTANDDAHGAGMSEDGYILQQPHMFIATPVDPMFIILPCLVPRDIDTNTGTDVQKLIDKSSHYHSVSDHLDNLFEIMPSLKQVSEARDVLELHFESALNRICSSVEAGDEKMYRLNIQLLYTELLKKAKQVNEKGLPASLEERFVKQSLSVPELNVKREESNFSIAEESEKKSGNGQQSQDSGYASQVEEGGKANESERTAGSPSEASLEVVYLLRLRTALDFIVRSYLSKPLQFHIQQLSTRGLGANSSRSRKDGEASDSSMIDFGPLEEHLSNLEERKKQAQALRSLSDNISRKRAAAEDEEAIEKVETKRRKKEEEDARKKNVSRGVKQLEKVDRSGMQKLSSFFTKMPPKK